MAFIWWKTMGYEWISYVRLQDWPKNTPVVWRVFTLVALVQIFGGALLLLPEVLAATLHGHLLPVEWVLAAAVFGLLAPIGAAAGLISLQTNTISQYRLLQICNLCCNLLLLPGCGFSIVLLSKFVRETDSKLQQPSWTKEEKTEEVTLQSMRHVALFGYAILLSTQICGAFLNCVALWKLPNPLWIKEMPSTGTAALMLNLPLNNRQKPARNVNPATL